MLLFKWLENGVILGMVLLFLILIYKYTNFFGKKKSTQPNDMVGDMVEIDSFNKDKYVNDLFETIFYSIMTEVNDWSVLSDYKTYTYKKVKNSQYTKNELKVVFEFDFERKSEDLPRIFKIKRISLEQGYDRYSFVGDFPTNIIRFVYTRYSSDKKRHNEMDKQKVDKSLESIKDIIGKSSQRASKIDELLN